MNRNGWIVVVIVLAALIIWLATRDNGTTQASPTPTAFYTVTPTPTPVPSASAMPQSSVGNQSSVFSVTIRNLSFGAAMTVRRGYVVVYRNADSVPHTITATNGAFDSGTINPGAQFSLNTADLTPGTYSLKCNFHPDMRGTLVVR